MGILHYITENNNFSLTKIYCVPCPFLSLLAQALTFALGIFRNSHEDFLISASQIKTLTFTKIKHLTQGSATAK